MYFDKLGLTFTYYDFFSIDRSKPKYIVLCMLIIRHQCGAYDSMFLTAKLAVYSDKNLIYIFHDYNVLYCLNISGSGYQGGV